MMPSTEKGGTGKRVGLKRMAADGSGWDMLEFEMSRGHPGGDDLEAIRDPVLKASS